MGCSGWRWIDTYGHAQAKFVQVRYFVAVAIAAVHGVFGHGVLRQYGGRLSVSGVDDGAALQFVAPVIWVRQGVGFVFVFNAGFRPVMSNGDV